MKEPMIGRRLYAWIIDTFLLFIIVFFFDGLLFSPLINDIPIVQETIASYTENAEIFTSLQDEYNIYIYDEENNRVYNENITEEGNSAFLSDERVIEVTTSLQKEQTILINYFVLRLTLSLFSGSIIVYIILPLLFKRGKTLGKFVAKLALVDKNNNYISWYKTIFRYLLSILINVFLSIISLGIFALINLLIAIGQKDNKAIYDLICNTTVIDNKLPVEFKNI